MCCCLAAEAAWTSPASWRRPRVPVVLTSGYGGGVTGRLAAANLPFLRKPYRIDALKVTIQDALRQQTRREPAPSH